MLSVLWDGDCIRNEWEMIRIMPMIGENGTFSLNQMYWGWFYESLCVLPGQTISFRGEITKSLTMKFSHEVIVKLTMCSLYFLGYLGLTWPLFLRWGDDWFERPSLVCQFLSSAELWASESTSFIEWLHDVFVFLPRRMISECVLKSLCATSKSSQWSFAGGMLMPLI